MKLFELVKDTAKKVSLGICLIACLAVTSHAAVTTVTLTGNGAAGSWTNVPTVVGGSFVLLSAQVTSAANNQAYLTIYDAPGTNITWSVGAYSNITSYVTNYYTMWTNYYGVTNYSGTNIALIDITNSVAAVTNVYPVIYTWAAPTNATTTFSSLNTRFLRGAYVTNTGAASLTLSFTYTQ